ncbi:SUMF1/EgtB/PvdO family nonheme iron enzyme [Neolewinella antarctica]|uniref:Sulfatase-modifying factor enzyme-like domain-containing protein n=1 Tax=Neolewinella antarctica TaxID=442734 RepID=A0ABX0XHN2_9BACT|nr:SUMF1/EgtB/PvdO family nonheme iron enzyme [Neolewinella antarctica]NJC28348.1 hypothetical protein [Neolewinella antarctica]
MRTLLTLTFLFSSLLSYAGNVQITNLTLQSDNGQLYVTYDLSWQNSWRVSTGPANFDAVHLFAKISRNGGAWETARMDDVLNLPAGFTYVSNADRVLVHPSADYAGNVSLNGLRTDLPTLPTDNNADIEVRIFGIEMVYIPAGGYFLNGLGSFNERAFNSWYGRTATGPSADFTNYRVTNENAISWGPTQVLALEQTDSDAGPETGTIGADFPKGTEGFFVMKYETTQQQYADFYNTLTFNQKTNRGLTIDESFPGRNELTVTDGEMSTTLPHVPVNYISTNAMLAYLAWAKMGPLTELEYVKACRGPNQPSGLDYVWGTQRIATTTYTIVNENSSAETVKVGTNLPRNVGNAIYIRTRPTFINASPGSSLGPIRTGGIAAGSPVAAREETGGTYYGVMDMAGNLLEMTINAVNGGSRSLGWSDQGNSLSASGDAVADTWGNPLDTEEIICYKGGSFASNVPRLLIDDRFNGEIAGTAFGVSGFRGVVRITVQ